MSWLIAMAVFALVIGLLVWWMRRQWEHTPLAWEGRLTDDGDAARLAFAVNVPVQFPKGSKVTVHTDWPLRNFDYTFSPAEKSWNDAGRMDYRWDAYDRLMVGCNVRIPKRTSQVRLHIGDHRLQVLAYEDIVNLVLGHAGERDAVRLALRHGRHALKLATENGDGTVSTQDIGWLEVR